MYDRFFKYLTDTDIARPPITSNEIHVHAKHLAQQEFHLMMHPKQLSQLEIEWLYWHARYDHLSWPKMDRLVIAKKLPKNQCS